MVICLGEFTRLQGTGQGRCPPLLCFSPSHLFIHATEGCSTLALSTCIVHVQLKRPAVYFLSAATRCILLEGVFYGGAVVTIASTDKWTCSRHGACRQWRCGRQHLSDRSPARRGRCLIIRVMHVDASRCLVNRPSTRHSPWQLRGRRPDVRAWECSLRLGLRDHFNSSKFGLARHHIGLR